MKWGLIVFFVVAGLAGLLYYPLLSATSMRWSAGGSAALRDTPNITHIDETTMTRNMSIHPGASISGLYPESDQITLSVAYNIGDGNGLTDNNNDLATAYIALNDMPAAQTLVSNEFDGSTLTLADGSLVKLNNIGSNSGNDDGLLSEVGSFHGYFQQHFVQGEYSYTDKSQPWQQLSDPEQQCPGAKWNGYDG